MNIDNTLSSRAACGRVASNIDTDIGFGSTAACRHHITRAAAVRGTAEVQINLFPGLNGQR